MKIFLNDYAKETLEKAESLLFNGNGFIGVRGNLEEAHYDHFATNRETYINGFYETKDINYPEKMAGFTPTGESMLSVVDGQTTLMTIDGEAFSITSGRISDSKRYVDLTKGMTVRQLVWTSPKGKKTKISISRLTSFVHKTIFSMKVDFERLNHEGEIHVTTQLNFHPLKTVDKNDPRVNQEVQKIHVTKIDLQQANCAFEAPRSQMKAELFWRIQGEAQCEESEVEDERISLSSKIVGDSYEKNLSYQLAGGEHSGLELSFDKLAALQEAYMSEFWQTAKIEIKSRDALEESVNYSTYALLQSLGTDGRTSISAKGLSGSGYEGHYFWDTEMYILPAFLHLNPELAKNLLMFRYGGLDKARENRALFGYKTGALYPWRTVSGTESSAFFEAGAAQHHINADIAHAFIEYYRHTDDFDFMKTCGFEVLLETARVFTEIGYEKEGKFHIDKLTGPDEYSVLVNDNYYTNKLVAHQFEWIVRLAEEIRRRDGVYWTRLVERLGITEEELASLEKYAGEMSLPFDEKLGIISQDRDFLNKSPWPYSFEETRFPLLLNYHPLIIYRHQITKQADAVLALMLFQDDFDQKTIEKSVAYYDTVTTHDSSLSYSAFSTVYSRIGQPDKAYHYFEKNARVDLDNSQHNTKDGIHTAAMGGTILNLIEGFCNLQVKEGKLELNPHLPEEIDSIRFRTHFKKRVYQISVTHDTYQIEEVVQGG
jgi:alpha,alpha-trehalose phosphorylase